MIKNKLAIVLLGLFLFPVALLAEEEGRSEFIKVGKEGDLRMSNSLAFSNFEDGKTSWRGNFDYYLNNTLSFSGTLNIGFGSNDLGAKGKLNHHFGGLGLNIHAFDWGSLDYFFGGSAGFTAVVHDTNPGKLVPTIEFGSGFIYFGAVFLAIVEFNYRVADYFLRDNYVEFREFSWSVGFGFKL